MLVAVATPIPETSHADGADVLAAITITGVSQSELARRLGVTVVSVNRWCRGKTGLNTSRWLHVLQALGLPKDWKPGDPAPPKT